MKNLMLKLKTMLLNIKKYWKKPAKGDYVSNKEIAIFCAGASGNNAVAHMVGYITFVASCLLVGSIYKINFKDIYIIGLLGMPFSFIFNPIYMIIQDNLGELEGKTKKMVHAVSLPFLAFGLACYFVPHNLIPGLEQILPAFPQILGTIITTSVFNVYYKLFTYKLLSPRFGKFICWVVSGCIPTVVMFLLIVFLPFESMKYFTRLWVLHLCFSMFNIFNVFTGQLANIQNVISPNTDERAKIMSVGAVVFSLMPSIISIFLPALVGLTGGYNNLKTYRVIFPIVIIAFSLVTLLLAFGVKERVIVEKDHKAKVGFVKGFKSVIKNKYFWIQNLSNLSLCFTVGSIAFVNIIFVYITRQEWLMGIYAGITGTAYLPGMILAPWLIKKLGKKNIVLLAKGMSLVGGVLVGFSVLMGSIPLFIICNYLVLFFNAPTVVVNGAMTADIWDYQQFKTGERLDGCSGIFGLILTPITTIGGFLIPMLYSMMNFTTDWDIMYVKELRTPIVWVTIIVGAAAALLGIIPYFFYDLTEKKHRAIIVALKERAGIQDEPDENGENVAIENLALAGADGEQIDLSSNVIMDANIDLNAGENMAEVVGGGNDIVEDIAPQDEPKAVDVVEELAPQDEPKVVDVVEDIAPQELEEVDKEEKKSTKNNKKKSDK